MTLRTYATAVLAILSFTITAAQVTITKGRYRAECTHKGISRVRTYDMTSPDIPQSFENFRIAFVSDTHYSSRFDEETLESLKRLLGELSPDVLLLGGDYQEGCQYVEPMMQAFASCHPPYGIFAILGNNDMERCTDEIIASMKKNGITLVEDNIALIERDKEHIWIAGAHNTFGKQEKAPSPTLRQKPEDFVILITHTPDYAEDQDISNADLTLAGHTHGGQVTLFGMWAPKTASHYGQRFLKGLNYNSAGQPVITSTGIGTSRKDIRAFAPSEVVIITLHTTSQQQ